MGHRVFPGKEPQHSVYNRKCRGSYKVDIFEITIVFCQSAMKDSKSDTYLYDNVGDYYYDLSQQLMEI